MLLRYGADHKDVTGTLIRANCKAMQIEAGIKGPMFQFPINIAPCLTDMWLKQSWFLCWQLRIDLATGTEDFPPTQQGDNEIMRIFLQAGIHGQELKVLNGCRMFLQVIFISDICTGSGTHLSTSDWMNFPTTGWEKYNWLWMTKPDQHKWKCGNEP